MRHVEAEMQERERSDSASSIKRKRAQEDEGENEDGMEIKAKIREEIEEFLYNESNKVNEALALFILRRFRKMEVLLVDAELKKPEAESIIRGMQMAVRKHDEKPSYRDVAKTPKVGKKIVTAKDPERVVLVYPTDESKTDSEETKRMLEQTLAPKNEGISIRAVRKIQKGGLAVESGTRSGAMKIRELRRKLERYESQNPGK